MYYPKTKILENQFTRGNEFVLKRNNLPYTGYYYILSNNTFFTGKTYEDSNTEELIKLEEIKSEFVTLKGNPSPSPTFNFFYPSPTDEDYKLGFITRYFIKKRNEDYTNIKEISPSDYNKFNLNDYNTNLFVATKINWRISGKNKQEIEQTNRSLVKLKEPIFPGFSFYFRDYTQFSK